MSLKKIVSGGQTGVDRGALDAALEEGFPCGGWCPPGRSAEDGSTPARYPLSEMESGGYRQRTIRNIRDSDATLIIHFGEPEGGTRLTANQVVKLICPHLLIGADEMLLEEAVQEARQFLVQNGVEILNVVGSRASKAPQAYLFAKTLVKIVLRHF